MRAISGFVHSTSKFARPTLGEAIDDLVGRGARQLTVVPAMLMAAGHVKNDVPSEIQEGWRRDGIHDTAEFSALRRHGP